MGNRLFLIDGHALMFRMYYALIRRPMINSRGEDTSVIFGFSRYLLDLIARERPSHLAVAFDPPCRTFRHEAYPEYKANRSASPEVIKDSLGPLTEIVRALGIPVLMVPGYEADDVIGSMARRWSGRGFDVYMVSPDKDLGQLVSEHVFQVKPGKNGAGDEVVDRESLCGKFGISDPSQIVDILAIWGDASDNVPGVKGIGEVGARKLVSAYGSVDGIMKHLDELPAKQAASMRGAADILDMSRFLVTIKTDVDPGITEEELRLDIGDPSQAAALFARYECGSLLPVLYALSGDAGAAAAAAEPSPSGRRVRVRRAPFEEIYGEARRSGIAGIVMDGEVCFIAVPAEKDMEVPVCVVQDPALARTLFEDGEIIKSGYGLKRCVNSLRKSGISLNGYLADIELMHYLINPEISHRMDVLVSSFLKMDLDECRKYGSSGPEEDSAPEPDLFSAPVTVPSDRGEKEFRNSVDAALMIPLYRAVKDAASADPSVEKIYTEIEMPLLRVLADMEYCGVRIDTGMLSAYGSELGKELAVIQDRIRMETGEPDLNISSPMQLGSVLFEKLKLDPKARKNKKGNWSTDEETLSELAGRHPVIGDILQYRAVKKLISTYIEPFPSLIDPRDGKVHTTFNQALTATGRLSSAHPNLQNIPVRTELGREIRRAFVPSCPGNVIVSADYSQIELRLMASVSGDRDMIEAFRNGRDIHTATAAKIFRKAEEDVTPEQRRIAKTANFGIIYGISAFGLSQRLGMPRKEAKELIDDYFRHYPSIMEYIGRTKAQAREQGWVSTIFGRRRYIKDINSRNAVVRSFAERNAVNAPIQGSAADIIKMAMNNVYAALKDGGFRAEMILQVHDELVFDVPKEEAEEVMSIVRDKMENVVSLQVPLTVECSSGANWLEAH